MYKSLLNAFERGAAHGTPSLMAAPSTFSLWEAR
jgi:hypothetical protein